MSRAAKCKNEECNHPIVFVKGRWIHKTQKSENCLDCLIENKHCLNALSKRRKGDD